MAQRIRSALARIQIPFEANGMSPIDQTMYEASPVPRVGSRISPNTLRSAFELQSFLALPWKMICFLACNRFGPGKRHRVEEPAFGVDLDCDIPQFEPAQVIHEIFSSLDR
jgi:hypothetical protein